MANKDEKELVLGNKQLISLFFVAVALCGVFFALGYMIGHNSSKGSIASLDAPVAGGGDTTRPEQPTQVPADTGAAPGAAGNTTAPAAAPADTATFTQPAREPQTAPPAPVAAAVEPKPAPAAAPRVVKLEAGATYVQVTALHQADAENLVKTLREQSLPVSMAESSKADLFRVLVGPYHQTVDVAEAKAKLKALGFANAFVQKQ